MIEGSITLKVFLFINVRRKGCRIQIIVERIREVEFPSLDRLKGKDLPRCEHNVVHTFGLVGAYM
jgi:hypothetical protein